MSMRWWTTVALTTISLFVIEGGEDSKLTTYFRDLDEYDEIHHIVAERISTLQQEQHNALKGLAQILSTSGNGWPLYMMPNFHTVAYHVALKHPSIQSVLVANKVDKKHYLKWTNLASKNYQRNIDDDSMVVNAGYKVFLSRVLGRSLEPEKVYFPVWSQAPAPSKVGNLNRDLLSDDFLSGYIEEIVKNSNQTIYSRLDGTRSYIIQPVHKDIEALDLVAVLVAEVDWVALLENSLPQNLQGVLIDIWNTCQERLVFEMNGPQTVRIGGNALGNAAHLENAVPSLMVMKTVPSVDGCQYSLGIHVTHKEAHDKNENPSKPDDTDTSYALILLLIIINCQALVDERQRKAKPFKINSFGKLVNFTRSQQEENERVCAIDTLKASNATIKPLAELFLETTVVFAHLVGFTAWSSEREPIQIFTLLEKLFDAFDDIAKQKNIFKIETAGNCYIAVCGVPTPTSNHASIMAWFAREIMLAMQQITRELEYTLGPETGELTLRVGIHSGTCTGGFLGRKQRQFQLFGDAMNTAAMMEQTSESGQIQISRETANLLLKDGKKSWIQKREKMVLAMGKGQLETYWLKTKTKEDDEHSSYDAPRQRMSRSTDDLDDKTSRLIGWNVETLLSLLKRVVSRQIALGYGALDSPSRKMVNEKDILVNESTFLDEVAEIITLSPKKCELQELENISIPVIVVDQLQDYVKTIAQMYQTNPFHNFEHASHVMMSVVKLLSRIVAPSSSLAGFDDTRSDPKLGPTLHDHTYGICSDPLTQFACALSALIHDVDHSGIPNAQLIKENPALAQRYNSRSVAEQNSLDLAWDLLMQPRYKDLRATLYVNECQFRRFRQLLVNSVMATDIVDQELKKLRNARWEKAFSSGDDVLPHDQINRKATIVIEHIIQASDVAHTMQHWHIYRKWNERFFEENYKAYTEGRIGLDPAEHWYKGELGFFDFYIIPLAKKLKDCGVFGISSDEYLQYALQNRKEWEERGKEAVATMVAKYHNLYLRGKIESHRDAAIAA